MRSTDQITRNRAKPHQARSVHNPEGLPKFTASGMLKADIEKDLSEVSGIPLSSLFYFRPSVPSPQPRITATLSVIAFSKDSTGKLTAPIRSSRGIWPDGITPPSSFF